MYHMKFIFTSMQVLLVAPGQLQRVRNCEPFLIIGHDNQ